MEKELSTISIRCTDEFKARVVALAVSADIDVSLFIRQAVEAEVRRHHDRYEALHKVFGNETESL